MRWRLNILSLNEETAFSLGSRVAKERTVMLVLLVAAVAMIISVSGIINWVGLIVAAPCTPSFWFKCPVQHARIDAVRRHFCYHL